MGAILSKTYTFLTGKQKLDDERETNITRVLEARLGKVEADHAACRDELKQINAERLVDRERMAKLEFSVVQLQGDVQISVARGLIACDENGIILEANHGVTLILGFAESELIGQPVHKLIPHRFRPEHETSFAAALVRGSANTRRDAYGLNKQGGEVPLSIELASFTEGGKVRFTARFWRKTA